MELTVGHQLQGGGPRLRRFVRFGASTLAAAYFVFLIVTITYRSSQRSSVLGGGGVTSNETLFAGLPAPSAGVSRLRLQEFHRVAIKGGQTIWEVRAKDAQYYSGEGITHLDSAALTLYQKDNSKISLAAESAKLHMSEGGLSRAELLGGVVVSWDSGMKAETEAALYELEKSEISAPDTVRISGDGYDIRGKGFRALVNEQQVTLARDVESVFTAGSGEGPTGRGAKSLLKLQQGKE